MKHFPSFSLSAQMIKKRAMTVTSKDHIPSFAPLVDTYPVLQKPISERTDSDLQKIESYLIPFEFFTRIRKEISDEYYKDLIRELRIEIHEKDDILFNIGDIGRKFYLILRGSVSVLIPKTKENKLDEPDNNTNNEDFKADTNNNITDRFPDLQIINVLTKGHEFGEISLNLQQPRTATVVCNEDSAFVVLKNNIYERIVKSNYENELKFLKKIPIFSKLPYQILAIIKGYLIEWSLSKDQIIYKEGELSNHLYIIKEGEVELHKKFNFTKENKNIIFEEISKLTTNHKDNFNIIKNATIIKYNSGEIFGEEEIFLNCNRKFKAIISSWKATIFALEKEKLFQNLKNNNKSLSMIKDLTFLKFNLHNKLIYNSKKSLQPNQNARDLSIAEKKDEIKSQISNNQFFIRNIKLKHIKKDEKTKEEIKEKIQKEKNLFKLSFKKQKKLLENFEISPILKMCAVSVALSKYEKSGKKFITPNVSTLKLNFENEIKKNIQNLALRRNSTIDVGEKKNTNYLGSIQHKFNSKKKNDYFIQKNYEKMCLSKNLILGLEEKTAKKFRDSYYLNNNDKRKEYNIYDKKNSLPVNNIYSFPTNASVDEYLIDYD